jgi:3-hydroxyacyl-CoA dehydrogenase
MGPFELLDVIGLDVAGDQRTLYLSSSAGGFAPAPLLGTS